MKKLHETYIFDEIKLYKTTPSFYLFIYLFSRMAFSEFDPIQKCVLMVGCQIGRCVIQTIHQNIVHQKKTQKTFGAVLQNSLSFSCGPLGKLNGQYSDYFTKPYI